MTQSPSLEDFARSCVRFVEKAVGVTLDFTPETLPVLDHYLRQARDLSAQRPESLPLVTAAAGVYLGEVIRQRHACHWNQDDDDPMGWFLDFDDDVMTVYPVAMAHIAIVGEDADADLDVMQIKEEERDLVAARLSELPAVSAEEYLAPSTRVEVIEMVIDLIRAYRRSKEHDPIPPDLD